MVKGLRIDTNGKFHDFDYRKNDIIFNRMKKFIKEKGDGLLTRLEYPKISNAIYVVYGYTQGTNWNDFDLETVNATGDIIIINVNWLDEPQDTDNMEIINYYQGEDLDDDILEDELRFQDEEEIRDMDLLDFIDWD